MFEKYACSRKLLVIVLPILCNSLETSVTLKGRFKIPKYFSPVLAEWRLRMR